MSDGFGNPLVGGGGSLVYPSIKSPNFVSGSAGWRIAKDGSAEFNNAIIRNGQVISGTSLYYNGTPALGNLIASVAAQGGTDSFGNAYLAGVTSYTHGAGGVVSAFNITGAGVIATGAPGPGGPFDLFTAFPAGVSRDTMVLTGSGVIVPVIPIVLSTPLHATGQSTADVPEAWHTPGLGTGWSSVGSPYPTVQYALDPTGVGGQRVWIKGRVNVGTGINIFTLTNALYQPAVTHVWPATVISGSAGTAFIQVMGQADTNPGTVRLINPGTATVVDIEGSFPLDA